MVATYNFGSVYLYIREPCIPVQVCDQNEYDKSLFVTSACLNSSCSIQDYIM